MKDFATVPSPVARNRRWVIRIQDGFAMSILLLHDHNLRCLKAAMRGILPNVRSGHLSESLASALGFHTHAALLATLRREDHLLPDLVDVNEFAFNKRLKSLGYAEVSAFTLIDLVRSDAVPDRPYAEFQEGNLASNDAQYAVCSRLGQPLVTVRLGFQLPTSGRTRDSRERITFEAPDSAVIPAQARNLRGACHGERRR